MSQLSASPLVIDMTTCSTLLFLSVGGRGPSLFEISFLFTDAGAARMLEAASKMFWCCESSVAACMPLKTSICSSLKSSLLFFVTRAFWARLNECVLPSFNGSDPFSSPFLNRLCRTFCLFLTPFDGRGCVDMDLQKYACLLCAGIGSLFECICRQICTVGRSGFYRLLLCVL